ncbi:MAG: DUF2461 domain-containing protein [Mangrovibacterium sp.]
METIIHFLSDLSNHNFREWFSENKNRFNLAQKELLSTTQILIDEIKKHDPAIAFSEPKDCIYRIYRDVRFSEDKSPYKNHMGSYIAPDGKQGVLPGYYLHIEAGKSFFAGGIWCPPKEILHAIRLEIAHNGQEISEIINHPNFKKHFPNIEGEKLKTAPKGFDKDHPQIELLRFKSILFCKPLSDQCISSGDFLTQIIDASKELHKINHLFRTVIAESLQ